MDDDYYLFDCPGQIELYTHMKVMRRFVDILQTWNFRLCGVFLVDSHFMVDGATFLSGTMAALSGMNFKKASTAKKIQLSQNLILILFILRVLYNM